MNSQSILSCFSCGVVVLALAALVWFGHQIYLRKCAQRLRHQAELKQEIRFRVVDRIDDAITYCKADLTMSSAELLDRFKPIMIVAPRKPGLAGDVSEDYVAKQLRSALAHVIVAEAAVYFSNFVTAAERLRNADANIRSARQYSAAH